MSNTIHFSSINDVVEYFVKPSLGDYVADFDVRGIADSFGLQPDGF